MSAVRNGHRRSQKLILFASYEIEMCNNYNFMADPTLREYTTSNRARTRDQAQRDVVYHTVCVIGHCSKFMKKWHLIIYQSIQPFQAVPLFSVDFAMEKALPVTDYVAFDSSVEVTGDISNMTAEQYLSWVRYQADELPDVFTADVDSSLYTGLQTKYMPDIEEVHSCPEHLLPSVEWERDVISAFSELRALLSRLSLSTASRERKLVVPQLKDEQAWLKFCLGSEYPTEEVLRFNDPPKLANPRGGMDVIENNVDFEQRKLELSRSLQKVLRTGGSMTTSTYGSYEPHGEQTESDEDDNADDFPCVPSQSETVSNSYAVWTGIEDSLPTTSLLLQFDQVMTQRLLSYQVSWLADRYVGKQLP